MYDSTKGQFLSDDFLGFDGEDTNLHRYAGNSPTDATDPTGSDRYVVMTGPHMYIIVDSQWDENGMPTGWTALHFTPLGYNTTPVAHNPVDPCLVRDTIDHLQKAIATWSSGQDQDRALLAKWQELSQYPWMGYGVWSHCWVATAWWIDYGGDYGSAVPPGTPSPLDPHMGSKAGTPFQLPPGFPEN